MCPRIELYSPEHISSVKRLNARLRERGVRTDFLMPERSGEGRGTLDDFPDVPFTKRQFVVLEKDEARGGFQLQEQQFELAGERRWVANIQMPISEGLIDRKYGHIAGQMMRLLLEKRPLLFAVGMGGVDAPFAKLTAAMKWRVILVPFQFYVLRPARFLREIGPLHTGRARSVGANTAAWTGLGYVAIKALQASRGLKRGSGRERSRPEQVSAWGDWADGVWNRYRGECSLAAARDSGTLRFFHDLGWPGMAARALRDESGTTRGWAAMQVTQMRGNKYFGDMRVGTLVDAIAEPGWELAAIRSAIRSMKEAGADLAISNHTHSKWIGALGACGFGNGPSNYVLATSPKLTEAIRTVDPGFERIHITRADGDGRVHL